jgi:hypothetical protein
VKQASNGCRVDCIAVGGYIGGVLFVDGGFCVGNELSPAFKQVPALNIWPACRVQGMGMGDGLDARGAIATKSGTFNSRHHEADS